MHNDATVNWNITTPERTAEQQERSRRERRNQHHTIAFTGKYISTPDHDVRLAIVRWLAEHTDATIISTTWRKDRGQPWTATCTYVLDTE